MSDRNDIKPNRKGWRQLSYTCRCGWVDWGHALPRGPSQLKHQIDSAFKSIPQSQMRQICGEVSVEESYRLWDEYLPRGFKGLRNRTSRPLLFPSVECDGGNNSLSFPTVLTSVKPMNSGVNWVRLKRRFVDGRLVNARRAINVSSKGEVSLR